MDSKQASIIVDFLNNNPIPVDQPKARWFFVRDEGITFYMEDSNLRNKLADVGTPVILELIWGSAFDADKNGIAMNSIRQDKNLFSVLRILVATLQ